MLVHVSVRDIALIDQVELGLGPGLTVLTGETGAGKSILVEALLLLLGARASAESVRSGCSEGSVQAQFALAGEEKRDVARLLEENGLPPLEDGQLLLRRVLSREGRHKQFVNGALATVSQMKAVAENLVDFTGQHAHQALLLPVAQLRLLDGFSGHEALVDKMAAAFARVRAVSQELKELSEKNADKERRLDVIRFYLDEIEQLDPEPGEDERLVAEQKKLANAERLRDALAEARELLTDGSDDARSQLQRALQALTRAARDDDALRPLCVTLEEACALVDDVGREVARAADVEGDPERLRVVEDRLDALKRLMKKHGGDLASVLQAQQQMQAERATLEGASERLDSLQAEVATALADAHTVADGLSAKRRAAARKLQQAVVAELPDLGMPAAKIEVRVEPAELSAAGLDRVEIAFCANAGEEMQPLARVASGGELSRVLLALKRALLAKDPVPVSIFDEVDAGVGGAVGEAIGEKLQVIAAGRQVLCITHLPQIAAKADQHLVVEKAIEKGRTVSRVRQLDLEDRVEEIARMLGGKKITEATRKHAEEMLARRKKPRTRKSA